MQGDACKEMQGDAHATCTAKDVAGGGSRAAYLLLLLEAAPDVGVVKHGAIV